MKGCFKTLVIDTVVTIITNCAWPWNDVWSFLRHYSSKLVVCCVVLKHLFFQLLLFHPSVLEPDLHLPVPIKTKSRHMFLFVGGEPSWEVPYYAETLSFLWKYVADVDQLSPIIVHRDQMTVLTFLHATGLRCPWGYIAKEKPVIAHKTSSDKLLVWILRTMIIWLLIRNATIEDNLSSKKFAGGTFFPPSVLFCLVIFCPDGLCVWPEKYDCVAWNTNVVWKVNWVYLQKVDFLKFFCLASHFSMSSSSCHWKLIT